MTDSDGLSLDASLIENVCVKLGGSRLTGKDLLIMDTIVHKCLRAMMDGKIIRSNSISHESNAVVDGDDIDEHVEETTCGVSREVIDDDDDTSNYNNDTSNFQVVDKGNDKGDGRDQHAVIQNQDYDDDDRLFSSVRLRAECIEKEVTYNCRHLCVDLTITTKI